MYSIKAIKGIGKMSSDGVCVYDFGSQTFSYCNTGFVKIFNTSKEDILANSYNAIKPLINDEEEYVNNLLFEIKNKGKIQNVELRLNLKSIEKFVSIDAFLLGNKELLVAIIKDISSAKQHLNYIVEFGARKDALVDMVAHNLSGPLNLTTNLLNAVDQLNRSQQNRKADKYTRLIRESTQQCIEIINSFLDEEHSESARIFVKETRFDLVSKVKIVVDRVKQFYRDKDLEIIADKNEIMVTADDVKLFQIVHNLVSNAVKFTPANGKISVVLTDDMDFFEVRITDTGIGIPEHLQPFIFQRNTPASRDGLKGEKSIGMGLYIVKKLAAMMGGNIAFESKDNHGSTFIVRVPKE